MASSLIAQVTQISAALRETADSRDFAAAVRRFVDLIATVPDYPPGEFSAPELSTLERLSEEAIERIERRVTAEEDAVTDQQGLVGAEYRIREALEEIDHWRRHYLPDNRTP